MILRNEKAITSSKAKKSSSTTHRESHVRGIRKILVEETE